MRFLSYRAAGVRLALLAGIIALAGGLTGCGGGSSNPLGPITGLGPGGNNAQVRFVHGSPDAGPIQVFIDNQQQFCTNGNTGSACSLSYGSVTTYAVNLGAGQHAIVLKDQNGNSISIPSSTLSVNAGTRYSIVLTGELHPSYAGAPNLSVTVFHDQPFNTPSNGAAVNFHYASTYLAAKTGSIPLQFGYFINNNPGTATSVGQTVSFGGETTPQGIQSPGLNVPITFFAGSATGATITPSQISSSCASNALPCGTGNLSLYLIDGPAASTSPTAAPANISGSATSAFVGTFD
jgi:hypothetical protein